MNTIKVALAIIINKKNEILLTQRFDPETPSIHLKWQLPGGGVEKNEDVKEACVREAVEETGLLTQLLTEDPVIIHQEIAGGSFDLYGFLAEPISGTINTELDHETNDAKWVHVNDLDKYECLENTLEMIDLCRKSYGRKSNTHKK